MRAIRIKEEASVFVDDLLKECQKILTDDESDDEFNKTNHPIDTQLITLKNLNVPIPPSISNAKLSQIPAVVENVSCNDYKENNCAFDDKTIDKLDVQSSLYRNDENSETSEDADDSSSAVNNTVIDLTKFDKLSDISCENSDSSNIKSEESFESLFTEGISASTPMHTKQFIFPAQTDEERAMIKMKLGFDMSIDDESHIETPVIEFNGNNLVNRTFPVVDAKDDLNNEIGDNKILDRPLENNVINIDKELNNSTDKIVVESNLSNETFVHPNNIGDGTFVKENDIIHDGTFVKELEAKDGTFITNTNDDLIGPPEIKIDRDETNSEDMTTVTPVNTPIEINYSLDAWDKIISSKAASSNAMFDANQPSTSSGSGGGGWFLHPPGSNNVNNDTFEVEEDDENPENLNLAFEALRKQLAEVLPHAQVRKFNFLLVYIKLF